MLESVQFRNFKALRDTTLPLGPFTLIVGPNGSGKSSALQALQAAAAMSRVEFIRTLSVNPLHPQNEIEVLLNWAPSKNGVVLRLAWKRDSPSTREFLSEVDSDTRDSCERYLNHLQIFTLDSRRIAEPVRLHPDAALSADGGLLANVLDRIRDQHPERFEALNEELTHWLPEYDRILFDTPGVGDRAFVLRTRDGHHRIPAYELSQGTLIALAILTMPFLPSPPSIACFEEPDRAIHPRLLQRVQDALYRLAYPKAFGSDREPVQVIATTHNPYFLDLYRENPEEVVIAEKAGLEARFKRLSDMPHIEEILEGTQLGDVWYTGILGGVPAGV